MKAIIYTSNAGSTAQYAQLLENELHLPVYSAKEAKKKQKVTELKEIRITPNIEQHDFDFKAKNIRKFIEDGNKVKVTVRFRGRELNYVKLGEEALNKFIDNLSDIATPDKKAILEGKNMFIILSKKTDK